jgi:hypothetical protein
MITKGIIKSINRLENSCMVRIPLLEAAAGPEVEMPAIIVTQPGMSNGYKEKDIVMVSFENGKIDHPVVIGKLYLGANDSSNEVVGALSCNSLTVGENATLPLTTKLTFEGREETYIKVSQDYSRFKSLTDIIDALNVQEQNLENGLAKSKSEQVLKHQDAQATGFG